MNTFVLALLFVGNVAFSWFSAWTVGVGWVESKFVGGWPRFLAWGGAVTSACGFTWCLLAFDGLLTNLTAAHLGHPLPKRVLYGFYSLGYLTIALPVVGSGLGLTVDLWAYLWRRRTFCGRAVEAWNTFAQISNAMKALYDLPDAVSREVRMFTDDEDTEDDRLRGVLIFSLVSVCLFGGVLLTRHIVLSTARKHFDAMRFSLRHARLP